MDLQCKKIPFLPLLLLTLLAWSFRKEGQVEGLIPIPIILFLISFFSPLVSFFKKIRRGRYQAYFGFMSISNLQGTTHLSFFYGAYRSCHGTLLLTHKATKDLPSWPLYSFVTQHGFILKPCTATISL